MEELKARVRELERRVEELVCLSMPKKKREVQAVKLSGQAGLVGHLATAWKARYGYEPTWDAGSIVALRKKRAANGHLRDTVYEYAFREVYLESAFWSQARHPLSMFVRHLDTFLAEVKPTSEDYENADQAK